MLHTGIPTCKTDQSIFCDQSFYERRRKTRCSGLGLKMSPTPQTSYQVSGVNTSTTQRTKKMFEKCLLVVLYFPNSGKNEKIEFT